MRKSRRVMPRGATMSAWYRTLLLITLAAGARQAAGQNFVYVEPGNASCPAVPASTAAAPRPVQRGAVVSGTLGVSCGFDQGSYTVTLNSTDPGASLSPKTFLVNFGRVVGNGAFTVTFSTLGVHRVSAAITSNMGSPAVPGHFASAAHTFDVVLP
jgi:hypothetical protein